MYVLQIFVKCQITNCQNVRMSKREIVNNVKMSIKLSQLISNVMCYQSVKINLAHYVLIFSIFISTITFVIRCSKVARVMVMLASALQRPHADNKTRDAKVETSVALQQEVKTKQSEFDKSFLDLRLNPTTTFSPPSFLSPSRRFRHCS